MGFLSKLFNLGGSGEEPQPMITDPVLGEMKWSSDDEGWVGSYNGFNFEISYHRAGRPEENILSFAREILNDPAWLNSSLAAAKEKDKNQMSPNMRAFYAPEIDELVWRTISFGTLRRGKNKGKRYIFAGLDPGRDDRCWRIEFVERTCNGLGFDS
jgi:hypothetical protein